MPCNSSRVHQRSGKALNALQLLYLRYRGRPGFHAAAKVTMKEVIQCLTDAGYGLETGRPVTPRAINDNLLRTGETLTRQIADIDFGKTLADEWQTRIFCHPRSYHRGGILKGVFAEPVEPEAPQDWSELRLLSGIGPKTEAFLQSQGIASLEQIAVLKKTTIDQLGAQMPGFKARLDRYDWPKQAKSYIEHA